MIFDFDDILSAISILLSLLLAFYLFGVKSKKKFGNYLFAFYLIISAIDSAAGFSTIYVYPYYPSIGLLLSNTLFLQAPFLLLYVYSIIYSDFSLRIKHLLHTIPFVILNIVLLPFFYFAAKEEQELFFRNGYIGANIIVPIIYISIHLQFIIYIVWAYWQVFRYKKLLHENFSNHDRVKKNWLMWLLNTITFVMILSLAKNYFLFSEHQKTAQIAAEITGFGSFLFLCWMVLKVMHNPDLFSGIDSKLKLAKSMIKQSGNEVKKFENQLVKKLKFYMKEEEPFLDASLSIHNLASQLDIPVRDLSVAINHDLNQNFFDFVNEYRINKAKELLEDSSKKEMTILEILYEVGFNSKSSFNTAFKKTTGLTPSEYRKRHLKSVA